MSDNKPRDDNADLEMDDLRFPGTETDGLTEAEKAFVFDDDYLEGKHLAEGSDEAFRAEQVDALTMALRDRQERAKRAEQARAEKVDALADAFRKQREETETPVKTPDTAGEQPAKTGRSRKKKPAEPAVNDVPKAAPAAGNEASGKKNAPENDSRKGGGSAKKAERPKRENPPAKKVESRPAPAARESSEIAAGEPTENKLSPGRKRQKGLSVQRRADPVTVGRELKSDEMLVYDSELDEIDYTDDEDLPEVRDYLPIRFRRYGRLGIGGGILYALFVISVSIILACTGWLLASDVLALNKEPVSAVVTIEEYVPKGDDPVVNEEGDVIAVDIDQVADELKNAGMIEFKWLFKLFSQFSHADTKIDPGTYDVSTELDYRALVTALQFGSGNQEITRITFPEGYTLEQVFDLLEENHICKVSELYESMDHSDFDFTFLDDIPYDVNDKLEGYMFPDTYDFYQGESADVAIRRFLRNLNSKFTESMRVQAESQGMTVHDVLTMASLIEKEAGSTEEMPLLASVIYNRLNAGMPLQLDTTINYIKGTSTLLVTYADTEIDDPYNTYLHEGLPPGPICNPGMAAIEAVLNPDSSDYWYWYAFEGENHFFTTYDEFEAYIAAHPIPDGGTPAIIDINSAGDEAPAEEPETE